MSIFLNIHRVFQQFFLLKAMKNICKKIYFVTFTFKKTT
ncbi:hypothetical protein RV14_GL002323 [Enterococcus ratti]|uniref:Uncharacterized protein n=1 Tax=Enterococcus ratti TaxID=150033 RepID=A0A1L8WL79_9ENTE|nr:hypothetical protein RV14_GL002323 [Enterococcus ratti]